MPSILFVCLGNICRSPLAEGALRAEAQRLNRPGADNAGGNWGQRGPDLADPLILANIHRMSAPHPSAPVSATEFQTRAGLYIEQSAKAPVFITKHRRLARVLIDIAEYER